MFRYDWSRIDLKLGLYHMLGVMVVLNLAELRGPTWTVAGISALLGWVTILIGQPRGGVRAIAGLAVFLAGGIAAGWIASLLEGQAVLGMVTMFAIVFFGSMLLLVGLHAFMVAWCVIYWAILVPIFNNAFGMQEVMEAHAVGVGALIIVQIVRLLLSKEERAEAQEEAQSPGLGYVLSYASVVATTICAGFFVGGRTLSSDPTMIAQSAFNVISPASVRQTWVTGLERVVFGTLGICAGFLAGMYFQGPIAAQIVVALSSFCALAFLPVSFGPMVGALFVMISYPWGAMDFEAGNALANERILAELAGVILAGLAIMVLTRIRKFAGSDGGGA